MKHSNALTTAFSAALVAGWLSLASLPVHAGGAAELGILTCKTIPGSGHNLLIHSSVGLDCTFDTLSGKERYHGETGVSLGIDVDFKRQETMRFTVLSASLKDYKVGSHMLAGKYTGGEASATAGVGAGTSKLIGGSDKSMTLVPSSIDTSTGAGFSGGVSYLFLDGK